MVGDKIAGWRALEIDPRHHGLRPSVIGARIGENLINCEMLESV